MAESIANVKEALLRRREVEERVGFRTSTLYERMNSDSPKYDPSFPKPIVLSGTPDRATCVRWVRSEVDAWIAAQIERSRAAQIEKSKLDGQGGTQAQTRKGRATFRKAA